MNAAVKAPKKVTVTPADPKYTQKDIRKQHLRVAPYCRVSTGSEEQQTSFTAQMEYYTQRIADTEGWTMVRLYADGPVKIGLNQQHPTARGALV